MKRLLLIASMLVPQTASAQPIYEGWQMGVHYKIYIDSKQSLGDDRWRFRTRAVYEPASPDYISEWRVADCNNRTFDGKPVPKVAEFSYQRGEPEIYDALCKNI